MANSCNKLMKEAIDVAVNEFRGIEFTYKLDDVLDSLSPNQKFSSNQLKGYLLKQGVSPNEIKQSGIFDGMEADNRAISAEDWLGMSGNQKVNTFMAPPEYANITLNRMGGSENSGYKEVLSTVKAPRSNRPDLPHFEDEISPKESLLGWRRTHVQEIKGKPTLVLNEFQSDWAQTERAGRGTFESSPKLAKIQSKLDTIMSEDEYNRLNNTPYDQLTNKQIDDMDKYAEIAASMDKVADFPMSEIKHHQFQIVGAIDDALKQGIDTVAIPIQRENELAGSAGVTKFYESLNKKILPDIRKKLEKQGMRIKVDKIPYKGGEIDYSESFTRFINDALTPEERRDIGYLQDLASNHLETIGVENEAIFDAIYSTSNIDELVKALKPEASNELWRLTVEEVPNARVKWDVYGLLASLGLGGLASQSEAAEPISTTSGIAPRETNSMSETMRLEGQPNIFRLQDLATGRTQVSKAKPKEKEILDYFSQKESKGDYNAKSSISSAYGKYQFLKDTLAEKARLHGMTVKDARTPQGQEELMRKVLKDYEARLRKFDLPITKENLFVVHNLGETGGIRAIRGTYTPEDVERMRNNIPGTKAERNSLSKSEVVKEYYKMHKVTKGS